MTKSAKPKQKILVIDDSLDALVTIEGLLDGIGARIFLAQTAEEARAVLRHHDIALIYLDIVMPDISGYDLAEEIHARSRCRYVPIIFVTALNSNDEEILRSYKSGVVDILKKPVEPEIIKSKTRVFLKLDSQRRLIEDQQKDLKAAFKRLQNYAQHDQLTGLFNREQITNILVRLISRANRKQSMLGVMFLDLDHFKVVNDSYGHAAGDLLLRSIAQRLRKCLRDGDYVARLGGDEFCVVLDNLDYPTTAGHIANRILEALSEPHEILKHEIISTTSIGISIFDGSQTTATELLKNADSAMYLAKQKGRSQYAYFSQDLERQALKRIELGSKLKHAIANNELETYYQPQYDRDNDKIIGFEALMRWKIEGSYISPVLFISIAEESGLINELGDWILNQASNQLKQWQDQGAVSAKTTMSVNISNRQLHSDGFVQHLVQVLKETKLAPENLELELTESTVMSDPDRCIEIFNHIHKLGVKVSVDDFGTGYSSLSYLSSLPLDALKIDRSFVSSIIDDERNQSIVKAIISLSHNLGLKVVAEGVETEAQKQFLITNNCDVMQGYLMSKPLPAKEIEALL